MKYKYEIKKFTYHNGTDDLIIVMDEEKYRMVAQFLMSDIQGQDPQYVFEAIDKVLSGKSEYEELNGNVCGVEIHREKTQIYDNLAQDGKGDWCTTLDYLRTYTYEDKMPLKLQSVMGSVAYAT